MRARFGNDADIRVTIDDLQQARLPFAVYCDGIVTLISFEKELSMFSELTAVTT
jgi:hypothetical protein